MLPLLERWSARVSLAADNGPRQCVLAGDAEALAAVAVALAEQGIDTRTLRVKRAFHSALIEPALAGLRSAAEKVVAHAPSVPLGSNLTGEFHAKAPSAAYWVDHARSPVRFEAGIQAMARAGVTHFVEIGPGAVLSRLGAACLAPASQRPATRCLQSACRCALGIGTEGVDELGWSGRPKPSLRGATGRTSIFPTCLDTLDGPRPLDDPHP